MGASTFSIFSSIFGLAVATSSLFLVLVNIFRSQLPSIKIRELESLLDETETFFKETVEDGLLIDPELVLQIARDLGTLRKKTYDLQSRAYNATTFRQDFLELCKGTSKSIRCTCQALKRLKAKVAASSEKARTKLMERKLVVRIVHAACLPALPFLPDPECHPRLLPCNQSSRPRSCPPALDEVRCSCSQERRSGDSAQSGPDVRTADTQESVSTIHTTVTA